MELASLQGTLSLLISFALFIAKVIALVDCVGRPAAQFTAIETLPKRSWLIILVLAVIAHALSWEPLGILNLLGTVGALVYLAQVRGSAR